MKFNDPQLQRILVELAANIRDVPAGEVHKGLTTQFFALITYLQSEKLIARGDWNLTSTKL